ncbi:DEAD/DEAH box helicase [Niabella drilacis]|uniref:Helicase conserved C-terminal domain-containing protein n=1 Tax=Niabella drilacis (strain DSM 25811 / CCM 8410 / CCUG 62505 / LMG 26954 / E90) TaxID=1285928 RepID=A0A1G7B125_NIADE|nr:DEAD/DEAH box helicase [Niabella drilacis]SDE20652.1 Helicase conserved C-terminal domain-containing protein [Niabella drilacis]
MPVKKSSAAKREKINVKIVVSHTRKPGNMTEAEWQSELRKQMAGQVSFTIKNIGTELLFSDYLVYNPESANTYKVALRSKDNSRNFCNCPDFKTNGLGTCKHIEAVRLMLGKKRGIKKLWDSPPKPLYSSLYVAYSDGRKIKLRIGSENQKKMKAWAKQYFDETEVLFEAAYFDFDKLLAEAKKINKSFRCYPDALDAVIAERSRQQRQLLVRKKGTALLNGMVKASLFPYQQEGVLFATKAGRSILADDMGLGKTLQAITWAVLMQKQQGLEKALIVCPTSLKYQWKTEIEKFTGVTVTVVEGNALARRAIYEQDKHYFKIVSYHVAGNDWQYLNAMEPDIIILDEAQRIKNWRAKISTNIKRLRSPYSLTLTGTPLENNIEELYSLVQFTDPLLLGSLRGFLSRHQQTDETGKVTGYTNLNEIGQTLSGVLLRRNKKEVLKQLPGRMDKNLVVSITEEQKAIHDEKKDIVSRLVSKWRRMGFLNEKDRQSLLNNLNMMRMVCNSTYILDQKTNYQTKLDELFSILEELLAMEGEKVVVFSQWERMTRLIAAELKQRNIKFENLHGGVPSREREALFTNFNTDPECRIFLSTDAGGVGLNLQSAAYMINMDIPWNPAVLEQRIARIYRMGQKKNVSIINLVARGTIEERMLAVLKFKSSVAAGVLDNGEDSIFMGDSKFKKLMESVEAITMEAPGGEVAYFVDKEEQAEITGTPEPEDRQKTMADFSAAMEEDPVADEAITGMDQQEAPVAASSSAEDVAALVQQGAQFFSKFISALSTPDGAKNLAATITEKDTVTGATYLKIPVAKEQTITDALSLIAGLLKTVGKN